MNNEHVISSNISSGKSLKKENVNKIKVTSYPNKTVKKNILNEPKKKERRYEKKVKIIAKNKTNASIKNITLKTKTKPINKLLNKTKSVINPIDQLIINEMKNKKILENKMKKALSNVNLKTQRLNMTSVSTIKLNKTNTQINLKNNTKIKPTPKAQNININLKLNRLLANSTLQAAKMNISYRNNNKSVIPNNLKNNILNNTISKGNVPNSKIQTIITAPKSRNVSIIQKRSISPVNILDKGPATKSNQDKFISVVNNLQVKPISKIIPTKINVAFIKKNAINPTHINKSIFPLKIDASNVITKKLQVASLAINSSLACKLSLN